MRKTITCALLAAVLAMPGLASAACTWTATTTSLTPGYAGGRSVKAVCTTGSETIATALANATDGLSLPDLRSFSVTAESAVGQTHTAGRLVAYYYDDVAAAWSPITDGRYDAPLSVTAQLRQSALGFAVDTHRKGTRIALIPVGVTLSAGNLTIYINGSP